jgi:hypothetical protein
MAHLQVILQQTLTDCSSEFRILRMKRIYFGVGQRSTGSNWYFRVKDPNGNVIYGPTLVPTSGTGFYKLPQAGYFGA